MLSVARHVLGDVHLAEEAVQQTFLRAWRAADRFEVGRDPAPWLYAIARRTAIDTYRRERRHLDDRDELSEIVALPASLETAWEAWEVRRALDQLPGDEREVLRLTHYLGHSHNETAELLGIPVGTVKSRSHRAHRKMASLLTHLHEDSA